MQCNRIDNLRHVKGMPKACPEIPENVRITLLYEKDETESEVCLNIIVSPYYVYGVNVPKTTPKVHISQKKEIQRKKIFHPKNLVLIKMCSDCETCGLLNHCK